ncbi:MAG: FHA domain-containing protein [Planctomycetota bacterium]
MSGYLQLPDGSFLGVRDGLVIGRVVGCDVVIDDKKASRRHARLVVDVGVVEVEDLQSSNGTLLNGSPVTRRMLRDGDEIRIGKTAIVYREGQVPGMANAHGAHAAAGPARPAERAADLLGGDDLFGGDDLEGDDAGSTAASSTAAVPPPPPPAPPKPEVPKPIVPQPAAPPPPAPAPARDVVEFEDEVVEVRRAPPKEEVAPRGKPAAAAGPGDVVAGSQRILQFSKQAGGNNVLGDDLAQMGGGMRALMVLGVLALGGGIVYGIITLMQ